MRHAILPSRSFRHTVFLCIALTLHAAIAFAQQERILTTSNSIDGIAHVVIAPDGKLFAAVQGDTVLLYDSLSGRLVKSKIFKFEKETTSFSNDGLPPCIDISPDGAQLAVGGRRGEVFLWDIQSDREPVSLVGHSSDVHEVRFSPDGHLLATGGTVAELILWDVRQRTRVRSLDSHMNTVEHIAFAPDGKTFASFANDGTIKLWDTATGGELHTFVVAGAAASLAFSPDGKRLISGDDYGTICVWDITARCKKAEAAVEPAEHEYSQNYVLSIQVLRDNRTMITAECGGTIRVWDMDQLKEITRIGTQQKKNGWGQSLHSMAIFPDERHILCGEVAGTIQCMKVATQNYQSCPHRGSKTGTLSTSRFASCGVVGRKRLLFCRLSDGEWRRSARRASTSRRIAP